ncbi:hypothetical protein JCM8208_000092 [Rhodotorula glutinis]
MSTEPEGACLVCGEMTKTRCSSCRKAGIDLHFCSPEHLRLVWKAHKIYCGPGKALPLSRPTRRPRLSGAPLPTMRSLSTYSGADKHEWHIRMIALRRFVHGNRPRGQRDLSRKASACVAATLERDVALTKNRDCIFEPVVSALRHRLVILAELLALSTLPSPPLAFDPDLIQSSLRQLLAFVAPFVHISDPYAAAAYSRQIKSQWLQRDEMCLDELWNDAYFLLSESDRERVEREQGGGVTE